MKKNIILIGFMGIGKGTAARAFSKTYDVFNIDTDDLIESRENRKIKTIFEEDGESYFRALEQEVADWIEDCITGTLISCGGGFYKVDNLKDLGTVVLLEASFEWIFDRLITSKNAAKKLQKRPLFADIDEAKKLFKEREKAYKKVADITINVENKNTEKIIKEIAKKTKLKK